MNRILLTSVLVVPMGLAIGGCSADDSAPIQQGTNTTTGAGDDTGVGGDVNPAGGVGGDANPAGGVGGGVNPAGGVGGMGGSGQGGAQGGAAGVGVGGAGGAGGAAGGGSGNLIDDVAGVKNNFDGTPGGTFTFKDSWFITGCAQQAGHDCVTIPTCPSAAPNFEDKGSVINQTFAIGGEAGKTYAVSFKYNGISEAKYMSGGAWAVAGTDVATAGTAKPPVQEAPVADDTFYIGGTATQSNYNVMRIRVMDATKKEVGRYYMNGYDGNSGAESHRTFLMSYAHTIDVPGGGFVEYHIADSNCHAIDNCGSGNVNDGTCNAARNIPNEPAVLPTFPAQYPQVKSQYNAQSGVIIAPGTYANPKPTLVATGDLNPVTQAKQPWHSQLGHLTVTKVVAK